MEGNKLMSSGDHIWATYTLYIFPAKLLIFFKLPKEIDVFVVCSRLDYKAN